MMKRRLIAGIIFMLLHVSLHAQCPDKSVFWKKIVWLKDSSASANDQLSGLLTCEQSMMACNYSSDSTYAYLLQRIGVMYYLVPDYAKAISYTRKAISVISTHFGSRDIAPARLPKCYLNLSMYYNSLGLTTEKNALLDSCISLSIQLKMADEGTLIAIRNKAYYLYDIGDYKRCIQSCVLGETLANQYGLINNDYSDGIVSYHINALISLKEYDQAQHILQGKIAEITKAKRITTLGSMYGLLATNNRETGQYKQAVSNFEKSFACNLRIKHNTGCAQALNNIGFVYFDKLGDLPKAYSYYGKALQFADSIEALNILDNFGNLYVQKNKFDSASFFFQKAFDQIKPGITETGLLDPSKNYLDNSITNYVVGLVVDKADAFLRHYKITSAKKSLEQAVAVYAAADKLLDRIRTGQSDEESKLFWRTHTRPLYEHAIEASYLQGNTAGAFYFFEKSRAVLLNDHLKELHVLGKEDMVKQAQFKKKLQQLNTELNNGNTSSARATAIQSEIFSNTQELDRFAQLIKTRNPVYYQGFMDTAFITVRDVQHKLLTDHQALLEFFEGDSAVYSIMITAQEQAITKINKNDFENEVGRYIAYLSDQSLLNRDFAGYEKTAGRLYQLLFKDHPLPAGRMIISPDGKYFPFESLITKSNTPLPAYFLNDHIVSYTYSARYLVNDFSSAATKASGLFLGVAPVVYEPIFHLASLAESDHSVDEIGSYFSDTHNLVAAEASKNNFLQQYYGYRMIQLYTHASDSSENGEPVIYFADSALYLSQLIAENQPATQLIVLSACETGNGKLYRGEGVFSFNRGFAALGIPSAVTNLWSVDNESTYKLTELFYSYVAKGLPLDEALQKAKLEFTKGPSKSKSLPYYWAATILAGRTNAINTKKIPFWISLAAGIVLMTICFSAWKGWRKNIAALES